VAPFGAILHRAFTWPPPSEWTTSEYSERSSFSVPRFFCTIRSKHEKAAGFASTQRWLAGIADVGVQVAVRQLLPAHHSTAALDTALGKVRDFLDSRSFVLRNKRRTNLALGLIRLHLNASICSPATTPCCASTSTSPAASSHPSAPARTSVPDPGPTAPTGPSHPCAADSRRGGRHRT
jgi:hypothetical protein